MQARQFAAMIRQERDACEMLGNLGIGLAEAVRQLCAEFGAVGCTHDHRRHVARPAEVIALEGGEQFIDVSTLEAADVIAVVHVARRRADHHVADDAARPLEIGQHADHGADRMTDEDRRSGGELIQQFVDVVRISVQRVVLRAVVGRQVGLAAADVVEAQSAEPLLEGRCQQAPHVLVAAEAMGEDHRDRLFTGDLYVVARSDVHLIVRSLVLPHCRLSPRSSRATGTAGRLRTLPPKQLTRNRRRVGLAPLNDRGSSKCVEARNDGYLLAPPLERLRIERATRRWPPRPCAWPNATRPRHSPRRKCTSENAQPSSFWQLAWVF